MRRVFVLDFLVHQSASPVHFEKALSRPSMFIMPSLSFIDHRACERLRTTSNWQMTVFVHSSKVFASSSLMSSSEFSAVSSASSAVDDSFETALDDSFSSSSSSSDDELDSDSDFSEPDSESE